MGRVEVYKSRNGNPVLRACLIFLFLMLLMPCICLAGIIFAVSQFEFGELEIKEGNYSETVDGVNSAEVEIVAGIGQISIQSLSDSNDLINAELTYVGDVTFDVSGETDKQVRLLNSNTEEQGILAFLSSLQIDVGRDNSQEVSWDVGLSPEVPINLRVEGGVGTFDLDLADLDLTELDVEVGIGEMTITVPDVNRNLTFNLEGGIGNTEIVLPEDAAVRIETNLGIGDLNLPSRFDRISGEDSTVGGEEGVWETDNFANADGRITIIIDSGIGEIRVR